MTRLQHILWRLDTHYGGRPYYVSGHAIIRALHHALTTNPTAPNPNILSTLNASHGIFTAGPLTPPPADTHPSLPTINTYNDLFTLRRPQTAHLHPDNTPHLPTIPDIRLHHDLPTLSPARHFNMPRTADTDTQHQPWYIHAYLHADDESHLPLSEATLTGLRLGGHRTRGHGRVTCIDTRLTNLDTIDYTPLTEADTYRLELITPYVLTTDADATTPDDIPSWWDIAPRDSLRHRTEKLIRHGNVHELDVIDHGQHVTYDGNRPIETARNGITRIGTHQKYGFGELRLIPPTNPSATNE